MDSRVDRDKIGNDTPMAPASFASARDFDDRISGQTKGLVRPTR